MKLSKIVSQQFSNSFSNLIKLKEVPPKTMFAIRGIAKKVAEETTKFDETRQQIVNDYVERDAEGNMVKLDAESVKIKPDKVKLVNKKLKELGEIEVTIPEIKFSDFGEVAPAHLTTEDLFHLEFIVE